MNLQKIRTLDLESFGDDLNAKYNYIKDFMDPRMPMLNKARSHI